MPTSSRALVTCSCVLVLLLVAGACGDDEAATTADASTSTSTASPVIDPGDGGDYQPAIDPARFVDVIDNPYLPLRPGARWVYEDAGSGEHTEVVVTQDRKVIMGISAVVVRDTVSVGGQVVEDTFDWFAQDVDGNVWYLGEHSEEHEDGKISTAGSWLAGEDGALPGIVMPAHLAVGDAYRQEFYPGEAEDLAKVVRLGAAAEVPAGSYEDVVVIEEWNPLEPDVVEEKSYAPGVGQIFEQTTVGGDGRAELVEFTPGT